MIVRSTSGHVFGHFNLKTYTSRTISFFMMKGPNIPETWASFIRATGPVHLFGEAGVLRGCYHIDCRGSTKGFIGKSFFTVEQMEIYRLI